MICGRFLNTNDTNCTNIFDVILKFIGNCLGDCGEMCIFAAGNKEFLNMFTDNQIAFLVMCGILIAVGSYFAYGAWKEDHEHSR